MLFSASIPTPHHGNTRAIARIASSHGPFQLAVVSPGDIPATDILSQLLARLIPTQEPPNNARI